MDVPHRVTPALIEGSLINRHGVFLCFSHDDSEIKRASIAGHLAASAFDLGLAPLFAGLAAASHMTPFPAHVAIARGAIAMDASWEDGAHLIKELTPDRVVPNDGEILIIILRHWT